MRNGYEIEIVYRYCGDRYYPLEVALPIGHGCMLLKHFVLTPSVENSINSPYCAS
jgi:hypothetical protein